MKHKIVNRVEGASPHGLPKRCAYVSLRSPCHSSNTFDKVAKAVRCDSPDLTNSRNGRKLQVPRVEETNVALEDVEERLCRIPFMQGMAFSMQTFSDGAACADLLPRPNLLDDEGARIDEGAVLAAFDQIGSVAIWSRFGLYHPHATLSLSIGIFELSSAGSSIRFSAEISTVVGSLCHTLLHAVDSQTGRSIAQGRSTFVLGSYPRGLPQAAGLAGPAFKRTPHAGCFSRDIGLKRADGASQIEFLPHLIGSVDPPALHGGVIAAGAFHAARPVHSASHQRLSSFTIEYLKAALDKTVIFSSEREQSGRRSSVCRVMGWQDNFTRLISTSTMRFSDFSV